MSGVTTVSGVAAVNHVAEEHKLDRGTYKDRQLMAVRNVPDNHPKQDHVQ